LERRKQQGPRAGGGDRGYFGRSYNEAREYKQEYRQGNCEIERKWERTAVTRKRPNAKAIASRMVGRPPDERDCYFPGEEERWRKVIEDAGIRIG